MGTPDSRTQLRDKKARKESLWDFLTLGVLAQLLFYGMLEASVGEKRVPRLLRTSLLTVNMLV